MGIKNKKTIIIIVLVILVSIGLVIIIKSKSKNKNEEILKNIDISKLINIEQISNLETYEYEIEKTEEEISTKYVIETQKYEVKANIIAGETKGKMIYIRGVNNLNIYKTEYAINKYSDKNTRINQIMQEFETICKTYMQGAEEYKETETIYGENEEQEGRLPVEESIYNKGRLYSKTYKNEENEYDINFYRKDEKIICEFVKVL